MKIVSRLKELNFTLTVLQKHEYEMLINIDKRIEMVDFGIQRYINACARGFMDSSQGLSPDADDFERANRLSDARKIWISRSDPQKGVQLDRFCWRNSGIHK